MTDTPLNTISEKLDWLAQRYWKFGQDDLFLDYLEDLYEVDDEGHMTSTPRRDPLADETRGLMFLARSGNGKTATIKKAIRETPVLEEYTDQGEGNTLYMEVPPDATIKSLAEDIAKITGYFGFHKSVTAPERWLICRRRLKMTGITTLVIDECHHILRPGPGRDVPGAIQALKHMVQSDHAVALIIAGVPELREGILKEASGETYRRFDECHLPSIQPGSVEAERFSRCVATSARKLGIEIDPGLKFSERVLFAEHGEAGRAVKLVKDSLRRVITKRRSRLELEDAERIFVKSNGPREMTPFHPGDWSFVESELKAMGWVR